MSIWYHLYDKGDGLRLEFLCVAPDFDAADAAAAKIVDERGGHSFWILPREEADRLQAQMRAELGIERLVNTDKPT